MDCALEIKERITTISSFLDYNSQPIIPRSPSTQKEPALSKEQRVSILAPALSVCAESTTLLPSVKREASDAYNTKALTVLHELQKQEVEYAAILMQSCIRRNSYRFVYSNYTNEKITTLTNRKRCCYFCFSRKQEPLPEVDFSSYFDESMWLVSPQQLKDLSRGELYPIVESLQHQLLSVEDRLPCNNKVCLLVHFKHRCAVYAIISTCLKSIPTIIKSLLCCFHGHVC